MTTLTAEIPDRITFDTLPYVLDAVSDSGAIRIYRAEDGYLYVVEADACAPAAEWHATWRYYGPVATDPMMDEDVDGIVSDSAVRIMARSR